MKSGAWKKWVASLKTDTYALYIASKNPGVPLLVKIIIGLVVAYALSPIDLIPDIIPVLGYLDDLVLLPLGLWVAIHLVPAPIWEECKALARKQKVDLPHNHQAAIVIVIIWLLCGASLIIWLLRIT